jgi:multiple sugar transport system substrate-binding protein
MTTRTSRREFLRMAAIGSAGVALAACGKKSGGEAAPAAEATAAPAEAAAAPAAAQPAGEGITLTQWWHEYGEAGTQEAVYRIAQEYSDMTDGVTIEVTWSPGDYATKLNSALAAGTGPDVYESALTLDKVRAGHVVPLDDLFTPEVKADFDAKDLALNSIDGKIYGVRMIIDTGLLYSRKSILDEAGIAHPTTWDELVDAAAALTTGRQKGLFLGNDGGINSTQDLGPWAAGLGWLNDNNEVDFDPAEVGAVYQKVADLNKTDSLLIGSPTDWWDPSALTQGLSAMMWTGLWAMPGIREQIEEDFYVSQFPPIDVGNGKATPATFWGGWVQFVNGAGKNLEQALAFVNWQWIENTDWQNEWATAYGFHVPPRKSAAAVNNQLAEGNPRIAVDGLYSYGRANGPYWTGSMGTAVTDAYSNIVKNGADPTTEMEAAKATAQAEMEALLAG